MQPITRLPAALRTRLALWHDRARSRRVLAQLDARGLADIGIDRGQAAWEAAKPFWRP
jgi:uncharacterized protein YjiS (DUF1127 family)